MRSAPRSWISTANPSANTGTFASLNKSQKGANGSIESITVGSGPQATRKVVHFGPYKFDLVSVPSGMYGQDDCYVAPAVGQHCTPYQLPGFELSPFYLENVASGSSDAMFTALVSFDVTGTVTASGAASDFRGTISTTFEGLSYQEALLGLELYGLENVPFTATFITGAAVAPEPTTAAFLAIGLAGLAGLARHRRTRHL